MRLQVLAFASHHVIPSSLVVPESPHEQGPEQSDTAHDHEDDAHRVEVETAGVHGDGEVEDRSSGEKEQAHADTHVRATSRSATIGFRISQPRIVVLPGVYPPGPLRETKLVTNRPIRP